MQAASVSWKHGATQVGPRAWCFRVWAPYAIGVSVRLLGSAGRFERLKAAGNGYYEGVVDDLAPNTRYFLRVDGQAQAWDHKDLPDPASRFQPEGVHGPSQLVAGNCGSKMGTWEGLGINSVVLYELLVVTYTRECTLD